MRHPRVLHTAPSIAPGYSAAVIADLRLRVVTPMFGGGIEAGHNDPAHLIRPSAIRGQLRFWWRACNAHRFSNLTDLHQAERALWGSAAKKNDPTFGPGTIDLRVLDVRGGDSVTYNDQQGNHGWYLGGNDPIPAVLGYALFPFTPTEHEESKEGKIGVTFRLQLSLAPHTGTKNWPHATTSVEAARQALWAWIVFGGVGARARRGCGTLWCEGEGDAGTGLGDEHRIPASEFQAGANNIGVWLSKGLDACLSLTGTAYPTPVPCLVSRNVLFGDVQSGAIPAWKTALEPLQKFLQGEGIGRNRRKDPKDRESRPGQSFWPEVGAARGLIGFTARHDEYGDKYTELSQAEATGKQFPRADLGLPRVMKLASDRGAPQVTLERNQDGFTRMASPIILKALPISRNQAIPIVLLLDTPHIWDAPSPGLRLIGTGGPFPLTPVALNAPGQTPTWPRTLPKYVGGPGIVSARDALLKYIKTDLGWQAAP